MTTQDAIDSQNDMLARLKSAEFVLPIVQSVHNHMVDRIFVRGIASDGAIIGNYSTEEPGYYVNPENAIGSFVPEGEHGDRTFESTGEKHKTKWFPNYKAYRAKIGRETAFMNYRMTELFKIDFATGLRFVDGSVIATVNGKRSVGILHGLVDKYNGERAFKWSDEEHQLAGKRMTDEMNKFLRSRITN